MRTPADEGALAVAVDDARRADRELLQRAARAITALLGVIDGRPPAHTTTQAVVDGARTLLAEMSGGNSPSPARASIDEGRTE